MQSTNTLTRKIHLSLKKQKLDPFLTEVEGSSLYYTINFLVTQVWTRKWVQTKLRTGVFPALQCVLTGYVLNCQSINIVNC